MNSIDIPHSKPTERGKEMYVKNSVTIEFVTNRRLTEKEGETLRAILGLQIEEPQDLEGNEEEWTASDITTHHNAIEREG